MQNNVDIKNYEKTCNACPKVDYFCDFYYYRVSASSKESLLFDFKVFRLVGVGREGGGAGGGASSTTGGGGDGGVSLGSSTGNGLCPL